MNKAFVREPDETGQRKCPRCGSLGVTVQAETLAAQLAPEALRSLSNTAFFCPFARCDVAYFDAFDRVAPIDALAKPVYPKDPAAPLCACFGLTRDDIEADIREGVATRTKAILERAKSPDARCATMAASGQSCAGEVQRYYMKLYAAARGQ